MGRGGQVNGHNKYSCIKDSSKTIQVEEETEKGESGNLVGEISRKQLGKMYKNRGK